MIDLSDLAILLIEQVDAIWQCIHRLARLCRQGQIWAWCSFGDP